MSKAVRAAFACAVCMALGLAPVLIGTLPVFLPPISREMGWGAAVFPQSTLVAGTAGALVGPLVGSALDRFGVRPILLSGLVGWSSMLFALSYLTGSQGQLLGISVVLGIAGAACGPIALAKVVAGWFDRHRGLALGFVLSAAPALATAILVVATDALISTHGWRFSYRVLAMIVICLAVPVAFLLLHEAPAARARSDARAAADPGGMTVLQALRSPDFWSVMVPTALVGGVANAVVGHFVAFSAERGISSATATLALSAYSLVGPVGPLLAGALADRVSGPRPLVLFYALPLTGLALLLVLGPLAAIPGMILMGVGFSACTGMLPYLLTRYFGVRHASQLFGIGIGISTFAMGGGPVVLGFAHDRLNRFADTIPVLLVLLAAAIGVSLTLRKYPAGAHERSPAANVGGTVST